METSGPPMQYPDSGSTAPASATRELVFRVRGARFRGHLARVIAADLKGDAANISLRAVTTATRAADLRLESARVRKSRDTQAAGLVPRQARWPRPGHSENP